jgi:intracellular multiplication protein IcmJ
MKAYPITLGVARPQWGPVSTKRAVGQISDDAVTHVFNRDEHTCQCCGFRSEKYQKILHLNGDSRDFSGDNVLTTCVFCHQCFHLEDVAKMGSGMLVWLPEIEQADLHHMMRAIYVGRVAQGPLAEAARNAYETLLKRGEDTKKRLGSTDPAALAMVMRDFLTPQQYAQVQKKLDGIRLLPLDRRMVVDGTLEFNQFPQILAYWRSRNGPFAKIPVQDWATLFQAAA